MKPIGRLTFAGLLLALVIGFLEATYRFVVDEVFEP